MLPIEIGVTASGHYVGLKLTSCFAQNNGAALQIINILAKARRQSKV